MLRDKRSVTNRKKYQREVNRIVRKWNQSIKNDWLWDGRFVLRQYAAYLDWHLGEWLNRCITEYWKVWDEKPNPNEQARAAGRKPEEVL